MSAGVQSNALHMASSVLNRMALALPVFNFDRLVMVMPTRSDSSLSDIFRRAIITSRLTIIMRHSSFHTVKSCSVATS